MTKPRVRTVEALTACWLKGQYLEAGQAVDVVGDEELNPAVFMLLADEPAQFAEVAE